MGRLYRPTIPLSVKCTVALRQLDEPVSVMEQWDRRLGLFLMTLMTRLAKKLGCEIDELRLDHDPPLAARPNERRGLSRKIYYVPDANDPDHLFYRPHGPEHAGSHLIKTNVRGDHGQHPDRVLIKKERRREKGPKPKRGPPMKGRGFPSKNSAKHRVPKQKWPKQTFKKGRP